MEKKNNKSPDLVQVTRPQESISLKAVLIFLLFIFAILVSFLFYLRYSGYSPFADRYRANSLNINTQSAWPAKNRLELTVLQADLAKAIGVEKESFPLKDASLEIKPEGIIVSGKIKPHFWSLRIDVVLLPVVKEGKLNFEIKEIKAMGVSVPKKIADAISGNLLSILSAYAPTTMKISEARLLVGRIILELEK